MLPYPFQCMPRFSIWLTGVSTTWLSVQKCSIMMKYSWRKGDSQRTERLLRRLWKNIAVMHGKNLSLFNLQKKLPEISPRQLSACSLFFEKKWIMFYCVITLISLHEAAFNCPSWFTPIVSTSPFAFKPAVWK